MSNASNLLRSLVIYGLCLPLAIILGYLLATPLDLTTFAAVGIVFSVLTIPFFLRWHHPWLMISWNMVAVVGVLPGRPNLWMCLTAVSIVVVAAQYAINRQNRPLFVPALTWPLLFLGLVVLVTAELTGGIGVKAFGGDVYGGRRYVTMLFSMVGYFALTSRQIPPKRAKLYVALFFLSSCTDAIGSLAGKIGPAFNFLFLIFPVESLQALTGEASGADVSRSWGLAMMSSGISWALLARYGLRGVLDLHKPWRLGLFVLVGFVGMLGGFRSSAVWVLLTCGILFWVEGLVHSRAFPALLLLFVLGGALVAGFATHLPISVQRSLSFLPIKVDPVAQLDAKTSSEWRINMWRHMLPEIPKYLLVGKGFSINPAELEMAKLNALRWGNASFTAELAGDYHNGPLSVILPLGIFGVIGFLWLLAAGLRVLYQNYRFGDPAYHNTNVFLFAYFIAKIIFFFFVFGGLTSDIPVIVGLLGLSVSLNGGVAKAKVAVPQPRAAFNPFRLAPGMRRPMGA